MYQNKFVFGRISLSFDLSSGITLLEWNNNVLQHNILSFKLKKFWL